MLNDILLLLYLTHTFREKTLRTLFRIRFSTLELEYCTTGKVESLEWCQVPGNWSFIVVNRRYS